MRPAHIFCALALATKFFPRPPPTLSGPSFGPINHHNSPSTGLALHTVLRTTCVLFSGSSLSSGRGAPRALVAHFFSLRPVTRHTSRMRDTRPAHSTRPSAFLTPPTTTKSLHRPLSASSPNGHTCTGSAEVEIRNRLCRDGNQPEITPTLRPSSIPTPDASRTRDLTPTHARINAQTPKRATPANPKANCSRVTTLPSLAKAGPLTLQGPAQSHACRDRGLTGRMLGPHGPRRTLRTRVDTRRCEEIASGYR